MKDQKIDELFRQKLNNPEIPFEEEHWLAMKHKLTTTSKRGYFYKGLVIGSAAAILLVALGWWMLSPIGSSETPRLTTNAPGKTSKKPVPGASITNSIVETVTAEKSSARDDDKKGIRRPTPLIVFTKNPQTPILHVKPAQSGIGTTDLIHHDTALVVMKQEQQPVLALQVANNKDSSRYALSNVITAGARPDTNRTSVTKLKKDNAPAVKPHNTTERASNRRGLAFIIGVVAAQDLNGVNSFKNSKRGFNGGITATLAFTRSLSITSGAVIARKPYDSPYSSYKPDKPYKWNVDPISVNAECRVLDIPLNLNYVVLTSGKNMFAVTAGASSYFMLKEDYQLLYGAVNSRAPRYYYFRNENRHYFGAANLAISYERKIGRITGIAIQPYLKIPLTGIGYGNMKLLSAGTAVSLNMNLSEIW